MSAVVGRALLLLALPALGAACASVPEDEAESYTPKIYRTGSNLPVKDYGAENLEIRSAEIINPANRSPVPVKKKPGG
jgi:hypothetical protein